MAIWKNPPNKNPPSGGLVAVDYSLGASSFKHLTALAGCCGD